jgi:hypothetical protein
LSEAIARQLSRQMGGADTTISAPSTLSLPGVTSRSAASTTPVATGPVPKGRDDFVQHLSATAERVAQDSGIPASFMLGQAGHETGWGKSEIKNADGSTSFNLFGIKAGKGWTGKVAEITTTEYINGGPQGNGQVPRLRLVRGFVPRLRPADQRQPALRKSPGHRQDRLGRGLCRRAAEGRLRHRPRVRQKAQRRHQQCPARAARTGLSTQGKP